MPTKFVRVRDPKTGTETSVSQDRAKQLAARGGVEILADVPATDSLGRPLPATQAATKAKATTSKETPR